MNTKVMVVGSCKLKNTQRRRPSIRLSGFWLNEIGFKPESLVSAEYSDGKIIFRLQGEGIDTYRKIVKGLSRHNSSLLQVKQALANQKRVPHLEIKGLWLEDYGFKIGSVIVVQSEHGIIYIRVLGLDKLDF